MIAARASSTDFADWIAQHPQAVGLLPFGAFEQHGPRLPLATDTLIAEVIANLAEQQNPDRVCLFPSLPIGASAEHIGFMGTLSVQPETLQQMLTDIFDWLAQSQLKLAILYNGHGGNLILANQACQAYNRQSKELQVTSLYAYTPAVQQKSRELFGSPLSHAGSSEASLLAALVPDLNLVAGTVANPHPYPGGNQLASKPTRDFAPEGIIEKNEQIVTDPILGNQLAQTMLAELNAAIITPTQLS